MKINELEESLSPRPLIMTPLAIISLDHAPFTTLGTLNRITEEANLPSGIKTYVVESINNRLCIISKAWDIFLYLRNLSKRISSFTDYLQDLDHDQYFAKQYLNTLQKFLL